MGKVGDKWYVTVGYEINKKDGIAKESNTRATSLYFFLASVGDTIELVNENFRCTIFLYSIERPLKYIYTYEYQEEQNWTTFIENQVEINSINRYYTFKQKIFFRIQIEEPLQDYIKYEKYLGTAERKNIPLENILKWNSNNRYTTYNRLGKIFEKEVIDTVNIVKRIEQISDVKKFILLSDSHYTINGTWQDTVSNIRSVSKELQVEGIIHLGDLTDGILPRKITMNYVKRMIGDFKKLNIPLYLALGNHDYNYFRGNKEPFTNEQIRNLYFHSCDNVHYYKDFEEAHLRIIFLESFNPNEIVRYGFDKIQLYWLEEVLGNTPKDYYIMICSHVPPVARLHYWSNEIRGSNQLMRILHQYQLSTEGKLLAYMHGHNHSDQIDTQEGFPIISIGCSKCEYFLEKKPLGAITYKRALGEVTQELWDVLMISTKQRTIDLIRFGAGENRHIDCKQIYQAYIESNKKRNKDKTMKKVITYGTFDLFHEGHYNILKYAKELGDYLIVGVTSDSYDQQRGKFNIIDTLEERIKNVRSTGFADEIIVEDYEGQKIEDIKKYDIDIFTLGSDWKGYYDYLREYCQVIYLERTRGISSTMLREAKYPIIRMGVVGTGRIAPRFIAEAKYVSGIEVQSAYNPNQESIEKFCLEYSLNGFCKSFSEFLMEVDAIYIAAPHEVHFDYAREALLKGKHVLCEKPLAFTKEQAVELFSIAESKRLVLMEGIKTAYCPGFNQIIDLARSGKIGEIKDVEACFSRLTPPTMREMIDDEYGGAFMEFGSYTLLPIIKLFGTEYEDFEINSIAGDNGVDIYTKLNFRYKNGLATSKTGIGVKSEGQLLISGTKGYILAESPWWLTKKFQVRYEDPNQIEEYKPTFIGDGLRYEISDFVSRIHGLGVPKYRLLEEESIAMASIVQRFMEKRKKDKKIVQENSRKSGMDIWAHRGCSYKFTENTIEAFEAACSLKGLKGIELDVQMTKDDEIVVFHDIELERLLGEVGTIPDYTYEKLRNMQFCDSLEARIPRFEEVLALVKESNSNLLLNVELKFTNNKCWSMPDKVVELIRKYQMESRVIISSFNYDSVIRVKEILPEVQVGLLHRNVEECIEYAKGTMIEALHINVDSVLNYSEKKKINAENKIIRVWNNCEPFYKQNKMRKRYDLIELKRIGVEAFITNYPEEYL